MNDLLVNTIIYFVKYIIALFLLFVAAPRLVFTYSDIDVTESVVTNFLKTVFWIIVLGYITVWLRLFELITILAVMAAASAYKYYKQRIARGDAPPALTDDVQILVINHVEQVEKIAGKLLLWWEKRMDRFRYIISLYFGDAWVFTNALLLILVFAYSAYLNFYDSFAYAAPPNNEAFLSLARSKYLEHRLMFYDGIYPQGLYFLLAMMRKFAQVDALYVIKFAAPVFGLATCFAIYFFVSRIGGVNAGGIVSAITLGWLGSHFQLFPALAGDPLWVSVMLAFFSLYCFFKYSDSCGKNYFFSAGLGTAAAGLVHPIGLVFIAVGIITLSLALLIAGVKNSLIKSLKMAGILFSAVLISLLPAGVGLLMGNTFDRGYLETVFNTSFEKYVPALFDYIAIGGMALTLMHAFVSIKNKCEFVARMWVFLLGSAVFLSALFAHRLGNGYAAEKAVFLWRIMIPALVGCGASAVFSTANKVFKSKNSGYVFCMGIITVLLIFFPQKPFSVQRGEINTIVEQYLKISGTYRPTQWVMVSRSEGFALAYGSGYHMLPGEFVDKFNPRFKKLVDTSGPLSKTVSANYIFIFNDRTLSKTVEGKALDNWIESYDKRHENIELYYTDSKLDIWMIQQEHSRDEIMEGIWRE